MEPLHITSAIVACLAIALCLSTVYMYNQTGFTEFNTYNGMRIKHQLVYAENETVDTIQCAILCAVKNDCLSASFSNNDGLCWMSAHSIDGWENQHRLEVVASWISLYIRECMAGWVGLNDTCYYLLEEPTNFTDGQIYCDEKGGKLAEPQTEDEFETLRIYLAANYVGVSFWIGLIKPANGTLEWVSNGNAPNYTITQLPASSFGTELCVMMFKNFQYRWAYTDCYRQNYIVCEI